MGASAVSTARGLAIPDGYVQRVNGYPDGFELVFLGDNMTVSPMEVLATFAPEIAGPYCDPNRVAAFDDPFLRLTVHSKFPPGDYSDKGNGLFSPSCPAATPPPGPCASKPLRPRFSR